MTVKGSCCCNYNKDNECPDNKSPYFKQAAKNQNKCTGQLNGIPQLEAWLSKVGYRNKSHKQNNFRNKPPRPYRKFTENESSYNTERIAQCTGRIQRCESECINHKLNNSQLSNYWYVVRFFYKHKFQKIRQSGVIFRYEIPCRYKQQRQYKYNTSDKP